MALIRTLDNHNELLLNAAHNDRYLTRKCCKRRQRFHTTNRLCFCLVTFCFVFGLFVVLNLTDKIIIKLFCLKKYQRTLEKTRQETNKAQTEKQNPSSNSNHTRISIVLFLFLVLFFGCCGEKTFGFFLFVPKVSIESYSSKTTVEKQETFLANMHVSYSYFCYIKQEL